MNTGEKKLENNENLAIVIAVFNEAKSISGIIEKIKEKGVKEIIVVEDSSSDDTFNILNQINGIKVIKNDQNYGFGYSIYRGLNKSSCDHVLILTWNFDFDFNLRALLQKTVEENNDITLISGNYKNDKSLLSFMQQTFRLNFPNFSTDCMLIKKSMFELLKTKTIYYNNIMTEFLRIACLNDRKLGFYEHENAFNEVERYKLLAKLRHHFHAIRTRKQYTKNVFDVAYVPTHRTEIIIGLVAGIASGLLILSLQALIHYLYK